MKQNFTNKTAIEKYKVLKDLEKGMSNKRVAEEYVVPRNSVIMSEKKETSLEKKGTNPKRQKLHFEDFKTVNKGLYTWFIGQCSQQIPIDDVILQEKSLEYAYSISNFSYLEYFH